MSKWDDPHLYGNVSERRIYRGYPNLRLAGLDLEWGESLTFGYKDHKSGVASTLTSGLWTPEFCMPQGASLADVVEAQDDMQIITRLDAQDGPDNDE